MRLPFRIVLLLTLVSMHLLPAVAAAQWEEDGIHLAARPGYPYDIHCVADGEGGMIVVYRTSPQNDVYAQRVDGHGRVLWGPDGVAVCAIAGHQYFPAVCSDGEGGVLLLWQDGRDFTTYDIYAQRIGPDGQALWQENGVPLCLRGGDQRNPEIAPDGQGGAICTWQDGRGADDDVYAQRVDALGNPLWEAEGLQITGAPGNQRYPRVVGDGLGGAFIGWNDERNGAGASDIYAQYVNGAGELQWLNDAPVCQAGELQWLGGMVTDGARGAIFVWRDDRNADGSARSIYVQRLGTDGSVLWDLDGERLTTHGGHAWDPTLVADGSGGAFITWYDERLSTSNRNVYAQRVDAGGSALWTADGTTVCGATGNQQGVRIVREGGGGVLIAWIDYRSGIADVYVQRLDANGNPSWVADGQAASRNVESQIGAAICEDGEGGALLAWDDRRAQLGNGSQLWGQRIERNGYWGYPSPTIASVRDVPGDQGGQVFLSWESSRLDPWPTQGIEEYSLWRSIPPAAAAKLLLDPLRAAGEDLRVEKTAQKTTYWQQVSTVPAAYLHGYGATVATLFDSTATSDEFHYFQVMAHATTPGRYWISAPDSARSTDDLAPAAPLALALEQQDRTVHLNWIPSGHHDEDLLEYRVYRGNQPGFEPDPAHWVASVPDTLFAEPDPGAGQWYYVVTGVDLHANEGPPSNEVGYQSATAVGETPSGGTRLLGNFPNPFNPSTQIAFRLAEPGFVRLSVYTLRGERVRVLHEDRASAGEHLVPWDGRDHAGRLVGSGVYLYRLEAGPRVESRRMVLLK